MHTSYPLRLRIALMGALAIVASPGCYSGLDYNHIECDVNAKGACPGGYVCGGAGLCVKTTETTDAAMIEGGTSPSTDVATPDQIVAVDQSPYHDALQGEAPAPLDALVAVDRMVDAGVDSPGEVSINADGPAETTDGPQLVADVAGIDLAGTDAGALEVGGAETGKPDAEWHAIDEFPIATRNSSPCALTVGADNNLWFCECDGNKIGRMTTQGDLIEYPLTSACSAYAGILKGPDNNIWFSQNYKVARLVPSSGAVEEFNSDVDCSVGFLTVGPDGNVWYTCSTDRKLVKVTTAGVVTAYPVVNEYPSGLVVGSDGYLYGGMGNTIARIEFDGSYEQVFFAPTINNQGSIFHMVLGPDKRFWYTYNDFNHRAKIGAMTMTGTPSDYVISESSAWPSSIANGPDGNIWITDGDGIARVTPSGDVTVFPLATPNNTADSIVAGPDGNLWFVDEGANKIGRIRP